MGKWGHAAKRRVKFVVDDQPEKNSFSGEEESTEGLRPQQTEESGVPPTD